jgi:sec-independent protein translocase protein TatA
MEVVAVPSIGWPELLIVLFVLLLLFGAKKLPDMARSIGKSTNEFKRGLREGSASDESPTTEPETPPAPKSETTSTE